MLLEVTEVGALTAGREHVRAFTAGGNILFTDSDASCTDVFTLWKSVGLHTYMHFSIRIFCFFIQLRNKQNSRSSQDPFSSYWVQFRHQLLRSANWGQPQAQSWAVSTLHLGDPICTLLMHYASDLFSWLLLFPPTVTPASYLRSLRAWIFIYLVLAVSLGPRILPGTEQVLDNICRISTKRIEK